MHHDTISTLECVESALGTLLLPDARALISGLILRLTQEHDENVCICWTALDLASGYDLGGKTPQEALDDIATSLKDRSIELGWEVIGHLLPQVGPLDEILKMNSFDVGSLSRERLEEAADWLEFDFDKHISDDELRALVLVEIEKERKPCAP